MNESVTKTCVVKRGLPVCLLFYFYFLVKVDFAINQVLCQVTISIMASKRKKWLKKLLEKEGKNIMVICDKNRDRCESTMTVCLPSNSFWGEMAKSHDLPFVIQVFVALISTLHYLIVFLNIWHNCNSYQNYNL